MYASELSNPYFLHSLTGEFNLFANDYVKSKFVRVYWGKIDIIIIVIVVVVVVVVVVVMKDMYYVFPIIVRILSDS